MAISLFFVVILGFFLFSFLSQLLQLLTRESTFPCTLTKSSWPPCQDSSALFIVHNNSSSINFFTISLLVCCYKVIFAIKLNEAISSWFILAILDDPDFLDNAILFKLKLQSFLSRLIIESCYQKSLFWVELFNFFVFEGIPLLNLELDPVIVHFLLLFCKSSNPLLLGLGFFLLHQFKIGNLKHFHQVDSHRRNRVQRSAFWFDGCFQESNLICLEQLKHITGHFCLHFMKLPVLRRGRHIESILPKPTSHSEPSHRPKSVLEHVRVLHFYLNFSITL